MFNAIGPLELLIIFSIILMVFGADKLPELARGLGKGMREFRRAANMVRNEIMSASDLDLKNPLQDEIKEIGRAMDQGSETEPKKIKDKPSNVPDKTDSKDKRMSKNQE